MSPLCAYVCVRINYLRACVLASTTCGTPGGSSVLSELIMVRLVSVRGSISEWLSLAAWVEATVRSITGTGRLVTRIHPEPVSQSVSDENVMRNQFPGD